MATVGLSGNSKCRVAPVRFASVTVCAQDGSTDLLRIWWRIFCLMFSKEKDGFATDLENLRALPVTEKGRKYVGVKIHNDSKVRDRNPRRAPGETCCLRFQFLGKRFRRFRLPFCSCATLKTGGVMLCGLHKTSTFPFVCA